MTIRNFINLFAVTLVFTVLAGLSHAQTKNTATDDIVKSATESGMQVIVINPESNPQGDSDAQEDGYEGSFLMKSQERAAAFRTTLRNRIARAPEALEEVIFILNGQSPSGSYTYYFNILFSTLGFLIAAELFVGFFYGRLIVRPRFYKLQKPNPKGYLDKLPILLLRTLIALVGLILVVIVSYGIGYSLFGEAEDGTVRLTVAYIYLSYFTARGIVFVWRMVLSPYCLLYTSPSPRDKRQSRMPSSA